MQETALAEVKTGPIAEFPAGALRLASRFTDGSHAELSSVVVEPGEDGRVVVMAATPVVAVRIDAEGRAEERVLIPGVVARQMSRRHADADLVSVRAVDDVLLSVRSFSSDTTVAVSTPRGQVSFSEFPTMARPDEAETEPTAISGTLLRVVLGSLLETRGLSLLQMPGALRITAVADNWSVRVLVAAMVSKGEQ